MPTADRVDRRALALVEMLPLAVPALLVRGQAGTSRAAALVRLALGQVEKPSSVELALLVPAAVAGAAALPQALPVVVR